VKNNVLETGEVLKKGGEKHFRDPMFRTRGDGRFLSPFFLPPRE
jgi:hypothetical protein